MSFDPSEFDSSDEHIEDYLDEIHPPLNDDIDELAGEYLIVEKEDGFQELDFDDIPI